MPKENLVIYVGRLSELEKRPSRVLETWRRSCETLSDWRLEIVGDGPDAERLKALAKGLPRVSFVGFQDPDRYYRRGKVLLLTSEYEGFGLVILEAMARACVPIVLNSCPAVGDLIDGDMDGILVQAPFETAKMGRALLDLAGDEARRSRLAQVGERKARQYDLQRVLDQWERIFVEVTHG